MAIAIRGALLMDGSKAGKQSDILIDGGAIVDMCPHIDEARTRGARVIDGKGLAAVPGLANGHAHSAMTLLRGAAEDMELMHWLRDAIWPREARMTTDDIYWGTKLACVEMLKTGTTFCNDMYMDPLAVAEAAKDSGMRFAVSYPLIDGLDEAKGAAQRAACSEFFSSVPDFGPLVRFGLAAHSVYATCAESLRYLGRLSAERGLSLHVHLSETERENIDCQKAHGMSPTAYLDSLGALGPSTVAAHCLWLDGDDWDIMARRGACVVHNPASNMKLASGPAFDYEAARSRGVRVLLGTDGSASNNGLDLYADAKLAGLLQKQHYRDSTRFPVSAILDAASAAGHRFFGTGAESIAAGGAADIVLVDLGKPGMSPVNDLAANLVYAGAGAAVKFVIVAGKLVVDDGVCADEGRAIDEARARATRIAG